MPFVNPEERLQMSQSTRARHAELLAQGLCVRCGKEPHKVDRKLGPRCLESNTLGGLSLSRARLGGRPRVTTGTVAELAKRQSTRESMARAKRKQAEPVLPFYPVQHQVIRSVPPPPLGSIALRMPIIVGGAR